MAFGAGSARPSAGRRGTILIIDDDREIAAMQRAVLEQAGFRCELAHDDETAWAKLVPEVDLVLLDILMPGQTGPEILARMRAEPRLSDIAVVFVTGRADAETRIQCAAMGAVDFIVKPVRGAELVDKVARALARRCEGTEVLGPLDPLDALLSAFFRLHQGMRSGARPETLAAIAVSLARSVLGVDSAVLRIPVGEVLRPLASDPRAEAPAVDLVTPSAVARCWRRWLAASEERPGGRRETHHPLTVGGEKLGVLSLAFAAEREPPPRLVGFLAAATALALDSAARLDRARAEALTDPLTGIQNRRYLENRLAEEVQRARSFRQALSVLFVDVDHFKRVNDSLGHHVGDQVLCALSGVLASQLRAGDTIARFGGDEFVVVLPETDRNSALTVAERIQRVVGRLGNEPGSDLRDLTVTIGMACYPDDGERPSDLLDFADAAMRLGKSSGRNRIERAFAAARGAEPRDPSPAVLRTLLGALDLRDRYTGLHSRRVAALAARLARRLRCSPAQVRIAAQGGLLHDIGKLHVPSEILRKPGPLDAEERRIMEQHARIGAELTAAIPPLAHLASAVRSCQEHWDGQGYPDGLAGADIPLTARIIAVADAYDAMSTNRTYRFALPRPMVEAELARCSGTQFDPEVVAALLDLLPAAPADRDDFRVAAEG
jgi:diguanylate cyclase (GGDEF)-like protein/putative nucleotidyltransferase with HDIG domain